MMNIPSVLWNHKLNSGQVFSGYVGNNMPSKIYLTDLKAICDIWKERLIDAQNNSQKEVEERAASILHFIANHNDICLLVWAARRVSVLFEEATGEFILIDET